GAGRRARRGAAFPTRGWTWWSERAAGGGGTWLEQSRVPRLRGRPLPPAAAHVAQALGQRVEDDGVRVGGGAERVARHGADVTVAVPHEDAVRIEAADGEVALELLQQSEHAIDGAAGGLAPL